MKKNNIISRAYHGTTTHYNFYFNGRERLKQGAATLAEAHEDKGILTKQKLYFPILTKPLKKFPFPLPVIPSM